MWFFDTYIGILIAFPIIKQIYDRICDGGRYEWGFLFVSALILFLPDTMTMILQPTGTFLGYVGAASIFSHLTQFSPFSTSRGVFYVYFICGGLLYREHQKRVTDNYAEGGRNLWGGVAIAVIVSFLVFIAVNRYQNAYSGQQFDIFQKYWNEFTLILNGSVFFLVISFRYTHSIAKAAEFVGRRAFGIYILHIVPMLGLIRGSNSVLIPDGSALPAPPLTFLWLLFLMDIAELLSSVGIYALEKIPVIKRFLPR